MFKYLAILLTLILSPLVNMKPLVIIESSLDLPEVSSGSGLAILEDKIYIVGDDSPYLYELDSQFALTDKHLLLEGLPTEGRIPKTVKPDFECMAEERTDQGTSLWMFGSGSQSPERDLLVIYDPKVPESLRKYTLTGFYERIVALAGIQQEQLNLEAAVILDGKLYLFNRGSNQLAIMPLAQLKSYLADASSSDLSLIDIKILELELAKVGNMQSRFSGACALPGTTGILFSATLEDTDNWIDDGEIHGSMLGILDTQHPESFSKQDMAFVKRADGQTALEKIESVSFLSHDLQGQLRLLAVADNDDGTSGLFTLQLDRNFLKGSP